MIEDPKGNLLIYTAAKDRHKSWCKFFNINPHKVPLGDAEDAYKSIGYKAVRVELGKKQLVTSEWDKEKGYHVDVFSDPEDIKGRVC
jgi:hypothetical protein